MIKFRELVEKAGAGDWGTDEARKTLQKETPGQGITDIGVKNKERKESVGLDEATDFRTGDVVHQVGSKLKGTVLHKGNQDKIVVKFGSVNKMIPASQLRLAEEVELDEGKLDKSSPIYKEYEALKKKPVADLRNIIGRSHRVADLKGYDKAGAIRQILDDKYGEKKVDAFFGFSEEVELDEAQWGADNPYKKYKNDPQKLKRMLSKNQDAAGNMRNRIRKFMGSAPSGLKDELKDIENRIKQIKDVMRESVELDEEKVIKIVADTNTRKYKEGEVIKTFPETKAGLTRAMVFQKTVKDRYGAETTMVRESVELDELDAKTYRSYHDKATADQLKRMSKAKRSKEDQRIMRKRSLGIATAGMKQYGDKRTMGQRIRGEEVELEEAKGTGVKKFVRGMRVAKTSNPDMKGTVIKGGDNMKKSVEVEWDSGTTTLASGKYLMSIKKNESVELSEGAVAVSTVEKEIRKNGATRVKKSDSEITFMYKGSERKIPVDRGFVKSDHYMKIQDMMEEVE